MINPATNPNVENPTLAESLARKTAAAAALRGQRLRQPHHHVAGAEFFDFEVLGFHE